MNLSHLGLLIWEAQFAAAAAVKKEEEKNEIKLKDKFDETKISIPGLICGNSLTALARDHNLSSTFDSRQLRKPHTCPGWRDCPEELLRCVSIKIPGACAQVFCVKQFL